MCNPADYGSREMRDDRAPEPAFQVVMMCTHAEFKEAYYTPLAERRPQTAAPMGSGEWERTIGWSLTEDAAYTLDDLRRAIDAHADAGWECAIRTDATHPDRLDLWIRRSAIAFVDQSVLARVRAADGNDHEAT